MVLGISEVGFVSEYYFSIFQQNNCVKGFVSDSTFTLFIPDKLSSILQLRRIHYGMKFQILSKNYDAFCSKYCISSYKTPCIFFKAFHSKVTVRKAKLDTVQNFLIKLGIKPRKHLWEISIFSLNNIIVRPAKIMNRADKNWAHCQKRKQFKNQSFQKISFIKVDLLVKYSLQKKIRKIRLIFDAE